MKHYTEKRYGGNGEYKYGYQKTEKKKTKTYYKQTTLPWKNDHKSIRST